MARDVERKAPNRVHAKCKVGHLAVVQGSAAKKRAAGTQRMPSFR